jgi:hypothetical protein
MYEYYKSLKPKYTSKDSSEFVEAVYLNVQVHSLHFRRECPALATYAYGSQYGVQPSLVWTSH